jgi:hypothetical protein
LEGRPTTVGRRCRFGQFLDRMIDFAKHLVEHFDILHRQNKNSMASTEDTTRTKKNTLSQIIYKYSLSFILLVYYLLMATAEVLRIRFFFTPKHESLRSRPESGYCADSETRPSSTSRQGGRGNAAISQASCNVFREGGGAPDRFPAGLAGPMVTSPHSSNAGRSSSSSSSVVVIIVIVIG